MSKRRCGIYKIHCKGNNRDYIGSALNHLRRWTSHKSMLRRGIHNNRHLQNAYNKYGKESFIYTFIEECEEELLVEREQYWIDSYDFEELMNSSPTASTSIGFEHSKETKAILKKIAKKRDNTRLKKFYFKKGEKPLFEGKKHSKETIKKLKEIASNRTWKTGGHNKGVPMKDEVKLKVSRSVSKNRRVYDDEHEKMAKKLRSEGMSYQKIANKIGVSRAQTYRMCNGKRSEKTPIYITKDNE